MARGRGRRAGRAGGAQCGARLAAQLLSQVPGPGNGAHRPADRERGARAGGNHRDCGKMDRDAAKDAGQLTLFDEPPPADAALVRSVLLDGRSIELRFARRRRRTIGIRVSEAGLSVAAPLRTSWREIEAFLREKQRWILEKLDELAAAGAPRALFGVS